MLRLAFGTGLGSLWARSLPAIIFALFVEELGIPIAVPGDFLMLLAGVQVAQGKASLWSVLLAEEVATVAGASTLFFISGRVGRPLILRYGRYVGVGPERLRAVEGRVLRYGGLAVAVGRLVPGFRIVTVMAAGVVGVPPLKFVPGLAIGAFIYLLPPTLLGLYFGPPALERLARLVIPGAALLSLAGLVVVGLVVWALRRSPAARAALSGSARTFLVGGLYSGVAALLAGNVAAGIASVGAQLADVPGGFALFPPTGELRVLIGRPLFLGMALSIGGLYGWLHVRRWPLPARLVLTLAAPLALTLALIEPLGDAALVEPPARAIAFFAAAAALRWATFAVVLELLPIADEGQSARTRAPAG